MGATPDAAAETVLVTGAAGFIGFHVARRLLATGATVIGLDNLNDYYDVRLKESRLEQLRDCARFIFTKMDLADRPSIRALFAESPIRRVVHLAAQAGVRTRWRPRTPTWRQTSRASW